MIKNYKILAAGIVYVGHMNWCYFQLSFESFVIMIPIGKLSFFFEDICKVCDLDPENGLFVGQALTNKVIRVETTFMDSPVRLIHLLDDNISLDLSTYRFAND